MPGTLYVVATPIGNLEDITLRALRVLREVALIAAEDTRHTARLLSHYAIPTPTISLHEHNETARTPKLIERILGGDDVALVSDAGTPLVSDPGTHLVAAARAAGIPVVAVPGPSAVIAALSAAGLPTGPFLFLGFPPSKANDLRRWLSTYLVPPHPIVVFYEAPHRIRATLTTMAEILGERQIIVARELTKRFEEVVIRPISAQLAAYDRPRGEFTVIVAADIGSHTAVGDAVTDEWLTAEIRRLTENGGLTRRHAAKDVAKRLGLSANEVYRRTGRH